MTLDPSGRFSYKVLLPEGVNMHRESLAYSSCTGVVREADISCISIDLPGNEERGGLM